MSPPCRDIFGLGLDEADLPALNAVPYRFHPLLTIEEPQGGEVSVAALMDRARAVLDAHEGQGSVDAIVPRPGRPGATLDGYEDGRRVFSRTWNESVPRSGR
ncbi:hypothetical protein ACLQ2N_12120 [Streptomyces sp. DT224]|uniref:hypothetical protein n=1 Tax=Streptomyces sp. DT224 TaxID=3393426 RepID=UPI003CE8D42D